MAAARRKQGGDFDAQLAAREAARREGKTLGEWLHGAIAERAAELGVAESEIVGRERADAVHARLERSRTGASAAQRRLAGAGRANASRPAGYGSGESLGEREAARLRRPADFDEDLDELFEEAQAARAIRKEQSGRRAGEALASFADLLERNEARRLQERESVNALTDKLASLESKLTSRIDADDHPIRSALARLEARLDSIGRRDVAESAVRDSVAALPGAAAEPAKRLEEKLDTILQAVQVGSSRRKVDTSVVALVEGQKNGTPPRKRLGEAIADISRRQRFLDEPTRPDRPFMVAEPVVPPPAARKAPVLPAGDSKPASEIDIASLAAKVDALRFDVMVGRRGRSSDRDTALASVRDELDNFSDSGRSDPPAARRPDADQGATPASSSERPAAPFRRSAPAASRLADFEALRSISDLHAAASDAPAEAVAPRDEASPAAAPPTLADVPCEGAAPDRSAMEQLEERLEALAAKVEGVLAGKAGSAAEPASPVTASAVEDLLRDLGEKIEAVHLPQAQDEAIDDLQQQLGQLVRRFEVSEKGLATLPALAESVGESFKQLEATQATVADRAAQAAHEAVRTAISTGDTLQIPLASADEIASLRTMQDEADARSRATLTTVHDMLAKVVDRLSQMEGSIAELRDEQAAKPSVRAREDERPAEPATKKAAGPAMLDFGVRAGEQDRAASGAGETTRRGEPAFEAPRVPADANAESSQQVDFIAAARRAAQTAQAESLAAASKHSPALAEAEQDARAGLLEKSRAFVASHKRPMLVGIAAILVVLGAIATLQRSGLGGDRDIANGDARPRVLATAVKPSVQPERIASATVPPAATPAKPAQAVQANKAAQPAATQNSDPFETGSISRLPAFAAQAGLSPVQPQAKLPSGLTAAAEAGNGAAAYALALHYAEGRGVPRDLKAAAHWFEKAAATGLPPAQYRLASLYEKGIGVGQDKAKARSLYTQAAEAGNPRAMHNLGVLLADGDGHPDYVGAAHWFEAAADLGVHDSQFNLAILLGRGLGVPQSLVQSYKWFAVAASHNDTDAAQKRDEVGAKLSTNDLAIAKALAAGFKPATPNPAGIEITPPPGGWDSLAAPSHLNSTKAKVSLL